MNEDVAVYEAQAETGLTPITDETLIGLAEQAERRIDAMTKIKKVSLKLTNRHDWTDQGGKPYLQVSGAEKIARMFGISWKISGPECEQQEGGHFAFTYKGYFSLAGASIEVIGTRSSKDGFFKKYGYENGTKTELPASEIDRGDVKKAAYTNCIGNGITRILGLRNMTYDDLREFAGISPDMIGKVEYKKKGKQDNGIVSEEAKEISTAVEAVRMRTKKADGTAMKSPLYIIAAGGTEYTTFSETVAKTAKEAKEACRPVKIRYTAGKFGNDIESMIFSDDGPQPNAERMAGEDG